jgi:gamma-glutamyltranspeptidase / glutathione hydrolase
MMLRILSIFSIFLLAACDANVTSPAATDVPAQQIEPSSAGMVATANPLATDAGVRILEAGGSAIDAAVAIESVLSLVEPQSSGLGGGGFLLHYDANTKQIDVYDGRERAPAGATPDMFLTEDGTPLSFPLAKNSGLSIGVPGMVALLSLAHQDHGVLDWPNLFDEAIQLSEQGFDVSPRLNQYLTNFQRYAPSFDDEGPKQAHEYFFESDRTPKTRLVNPAYAETLRTIQKDATAFYRGELALEIVTQANAEPRAGSLAISDMQSYQAIKTTPLCVPYKELSLCGPPPPSSWAAVGMIMRMLESAPRFSGENQTRDWTMVGEALRLAYADRDQYVADTEFVEVPLSGLLSEEYLVQRAAEIDPDRATTQITFGNPWEFEDVPTAQYGLDATEHFAGTTHFSVMDAAGNVVAMTATVESVFGSSRMAGGMFLNNELTDFSRTPFDAEGAPIANAVEPFKRPRSSMSPTIVLDEDGEFYLSTGSPGGNSIISYVIKTLVGVIDWGLSPQEAINLPNMIARGDTVRIENQASPELIQALNDYGFSVRETAGENSGLSMIIRNPDGSLSGGVDPRREGTVGIPNL